MDISEARHRTRSYPAEELAGLLGLDAGEELTNITIDRSRGLDSVAVVVETRQRAGVAVPAGSGM